ncbi:MAG: hypothetical protein FGM15_02520 [Chthoniobacterales bacterium]|nr:hypothetical protein [Chthoniobacterales bacterium]
MSEEAPLLDLSALDFRPAWAKDPSSAPQPSPAPREHRPAPRGGFKRVGKPGGQPRPGRGRPHGKKFDDARREERPAPPPNPFPWLRIAFTATAPAVETVVQQVRHTGKTFGLFDIARILLRNPASYTIDLTSAPKQPEGPFWVAEADSSVWLSREAAVRHVLRKKRDEFYRAETVEVAPPKGNFPVVAVCGMSGVLLGPPNHHDFERRLRELHRERFSRMDFETFRSRLKMERDPEIVEKWRAEASKAVEYYPREGENPEKLADLAAVERHFAEHHAPALVKLVDHAAVPGDPKTTAVDAALAPLLNHARGEEERFPLRLAQSLSRALTAAGLRFYKGASRTTFVSASRPRYLDLDQTAVSDSIRKIIETIREKKSIRRAQLLGQLVPRASTAPVAPAEAPADPSAPAPEAAPAADPAREAVINDLLWLTHEGYVIEYADGRLESVPPPKNPPKPAVVAQDAPAAAVAEAEPAAPPASV